MIRGLKCYVVELKAPSYSDTACISRSGKDVYVEVQHGKFYTLAEDMADVAEEFPEAISIICIGVGHLLNLVLEK